MFKLTNFKKYRISDWRRMKRTTVFLMILVLGLLVVSFLEIASCYMTTATAVSYPTPELSVLVVILSSAGHGQLRHQIRTSGWLARSRGVLNHVFLVGNDVDLREEVEVYDDVVLWEGPDSYKNIVYKFSWFLAKLGHDNKVELYDYILKTDDDSFINTGHLGALLRHLPRDIAWYGGECIINKSVTRSGSKHQVDLYHYPQPSYPTYAAGAGYILSKRLVKRLLAAMWRVPMFRVEDAYMGVVAEEVGVSATCLENFHHTSWREVEGLREAVLLHKVSLRDINIILSLVP